MAYEKAFQNTLVAARESADFWKAVNFIKFKPVFGNNINLKSWKEFSNGLHPPKISLDLAWTVNMHPLLVYLAPDMK